MPLKSNEDRVTRRGPDGTLYQWSNAQEKPSGDGWVQASKASFPRVRTYLWFRPATYIDQDREKALKAKQAAENPSSIEQLSGMIFKPWEYMKQTHARLMAKRNVPSYAPNTRVTFGGQTYYTQGGVDQVEYTIKIKNPVTGETKTVNAKELINASDNPKQYAVGDRVVLAKGAIDTKEQEVMVLGYDAATGTYKVSLSALDPKQRDIKDAFTVYPEAIDAFVPEKVTKSKLPLMDDLITDTDEKRIVEALHRATVSGRNSVQVKEIISDLRAHGVQVGEHQVVYTLTMLNRVDPSIQYNSASGGVYLGVAKPSLEQLMRARNIEPLKDQFGLTNLTQDSNTDTYAHPGIRVKNDSINGIIDTIVGDIAEVITSDRKRMQVKLAELTDEFNRNLHVDTAAPRYVGNVRNKDIFWVLRDREGVKRIKIGDTVSLLPGISNMKVNKDQPMSGRVVAVNNDGTVDMDATVGKQTTRIRAFNRQLMKTPNFKNMQELRDYINFHKHAVPGSSMKVNNTEVIFGDRRHKSITLNFENGEDYAKNEHLWFTPIESHANPSGWESVIRSLGSFWSQSGDPNGTLAPSRELLGYINEIYPNAREITIARDTTTDPNRIMGVQSKIQFKVGIDSNMRGKTYSMDRLAEYYGKQTEKTPIGASNIGESNSIRISTDGDTMYIHLGKLFKEYRADKLPPLELHETELGAMTAKQRKAYEENRGPATFRDMVNSRMFNRHRAWGAALSKEDIDDSGVFTYDEDNDRYMEDMGHYSKAIKFLKTFFGESAFNSHAFETLDKGWYGYAANEVLKPIAMPYERELKELDAVKKDVAPIDIKGLAGSVELRPYQNAAVKFILKNNATLLAMDQGTGKSITAISAAVEKLNRLNAQNPMRKHKVLVIAPASVAQTSWMKDLDKTIVPRTDRGVVLKGKYNYTLLMGPDRTEGYKRLVDPKDNTSIAVTSYDTFAKSDWQEIKDIGFDVAIIDEAQALSGSDDAKMITERVQLMLNDIRHKMALTGTPLENEPADLQAILAWLKPETFGDKTQFMNDFVDNDYRESTDAAGKKYIRKVGVRLKNIKSLRSKINRMMFRIEKSDLLDYNQPNATNVIKTDDLHKYIKRYTAPDIDPASKQRLGEISVLPNRSVYPAYGFKQNPQTKKMYLDFQGDYNPITLDGYDDYKNLIMLAKQRMRQEYVRRLEAGLPVNSRGFLFRMQQVLNDPSLLAKDYGAEFNVNVRNPKVDRMLNIISNHFPTNAFKRQENGKVIIFAEHVETLKFLERRLTEQYPQLQGRLIKYMGQGHADMQNAEGIKTRQDIESAFNNDPDFKYPIMLATNAAKTGVNLPAANMVINYDIGWNPQDINQRIDRAHRIRSLKDVASNMTAPARDVTAHLLAVTDHSGDINYSIEARKLFTHKVKEHIFNTFIRGAEERNEVQLPEEDHTKMAEELLNVADTERPIRVDPERARRSEQTRELKRTQRELTKQYGPLARYLRAYSGES